MTDMKMLVGRNLDDPKAVMLQFGSGEEAVWVSLTVDGALNLADALKSVAAEVMRNEQPQDVATDDNADVS